MNFACNVCCREIFLARRECDCRQPVFELTASGLAENSDFFAVVDLRDADIGVPADRDDMPSIGDKFRIGDSVAVSANRLQQFAIIRFEQINLPRANLARLPGRNQLAVRRKRGVNQSSRNELPPDLSGTVRVLFGFPFRKLRSAADRTSTYASQHPTT